MFLIWRTLSQIVNRSNAQASEPNEKQMGRPNRYCRQTHDRGRLFRSCFLFCFLWHFRFLPLKMFKIVIKNIIFMWFSEFTHFVWNFAFFLWNLIKVKKIQKLFENYNFFVNLKLENVCKFQQVIAIFFLNVGRF